MNDVVIQFPFTFGEELPVKGTTSFTSVRSGGLLTTSDERYIWRDRVYMAIGTVYGERVMTPTYGSKVTSYLFENIDLAIQSAKEDVSDTFRKWLPTLGLISVNAEYNDYSEEIIITINYTLPNGTPDELSFSTGVFDRYGTLIQKGI